jgi:predicted DNA-binding antitoxin AbrB/MazE fold protein
MKPVEASYENGLLRPAKPLPLVEGEHVRVIVVRKPDPKRWDLSRLSAAVDDEDTALTEAGLGAWAAALETEDTT